MQQGTAACRYGGLCQGLRAIAVDVRVHEFPDLGAIFRAVRGDGGIGLDDHRVDPRTVDWIRSGGTVTRPESRLGGSASAGGSYRVTSWPSATIRELAVEVVPAHVHAHEAAGLVQALRPFAEPVAGDLTTHILQEAEELCDTFAIIDRGKSLVQGDLAMIRSLSSRAFDMAMTFASLTPQLLDELRQLPVLKLDVKRTTVTLCVHGKEMSALDTLRSLSYRYTITHFEVSGATLEDVFLELLGNRQRESS